MYQFSYSEVAEDSREEMRLLERSVLDRAIELLRNAQAKGPGSRELVEALFFYRRLWSIFMDDLANPENELPEEVRAGLLSIGIWMVKEIELIRSNKASDLTAMIEISEIIRDGLNEADVNISLRADEKIYINGAVLRVDRKVSIELLNDVTFLLESHVMQANDATTPLRQIYFVVQIMLMDPDAKPAALELSRKLVDAALRAFEDREILAGLKAVDELIVCSRYFDAMKALRALFPSERATMAAEAKASAPHAA